MDNDYKYPVYIECHRCLNTDEEKRIEKYFQIRRRSGGGECAPLEKVNDKVFMIAFRHEKDQLRVLGVSEHVLEVPGGHLSLTVRGSLGSPNPPLTTSTPNLKISPDPGLIPPAQSHLSILASTLPSSGVEHELQLDTYLQHYLRECPRAGKDLEQELSSMGCSLQFHPEEEMVLITGSVQTDTGGDAVKQWKAQVEKLFERIQERYLCHFEMDLHKVRVLLQSRSSGQASDDVQVYSELGLAVVVGEHSQVQARLRDLEESQVKEPSQKQGLGASQKQTTTRRLGEAKLRLLWDEIEHGLGDFTPGVKVMQGDAGQVVLEGFVGEVLKAGEWISKKEDHVLETVVPEVSPHLLAFLRKEYGVPGVLEALLGVNGNVEIELGDTELRLFTLSSGKLEETETALQGEFKELKIDVPNYSAVLPELRAKLESKVDEMNQIRRRALVRFCSGSQIYLLGHTKEVGELKEEIARFILDEPSQEVTVPLPFPEIADCLPELLLLHGFVNSGVTYRLVASSSSPSVVLTGPPSHVTQVRSRLGSVLNSLVRETITIDQPGTLRYFQSPSGREKLQSVGHSQQCLIQLQDQDHTTEEAWVSSGGVTQATTVASYHLNSGLQVLVRQGDITKEHADALVNAANEYLDHGGGVAAALSHAGGSKVQKESRDLVRQIGTIPTGDVAVTTGGNLNCKKLFHAVGPVEGAVGGRGRALLEQTVRAALNKAETMKFQTIAMPCISSGIFGFPVKVCAEAIVTAVRDFGSQGRSLKKVTLIDNRGEVVSAMKETCDRLLRGMDTAPSAPEADVFQGDSSAAVPGRVATAGTAVDCIQVEIIQGNIEKQQVDALVCPMVGHDPLSTGVGITLSSLVGRQLAEAFHKVAGGATLPGENVLVKGLSGLACDKVLFLNLIPWDSNPKGIAVQTLRQAVRTTLVSCDQSGLGSIALPALGTIAPLGFPHNVVAEVLLEEIRRYEENPNRTIFLVRIIVHPNDKESTKAFQSAQEALHLKGFTNDADPDQASFYRHLSSTEDEVTAMLGGVRLQLVCGDIIHETTDVIVNTTNFSKKQSGVSKAILSAAGPSVQAEFARAGIPSDLMCTTGPGSLACREIIHARFKREGQRIRRTCGKILEICERRGYRSAAFPAINTGAAGMDFNTACKAMLDGMASAVRDLNPNVLSLIRIVTLQRPVFQAFRSELESRLGQLAPRITLREKTNQMFKKIQDWGSSTSQGPQSSPSDTPSLPLTPWRPPPAVLCVIGCGSDDIAASVKRDLETILLQQLTEKEVDGKDFYRLDTTELETVQVTARSLGVSLEPVEAQREESEEENGAGAGVGAGGQSGLEGEVSYMLRGLKEDVLSVIELVDRALRRPDHRDLPGEEEAMLTHTVQWSMQDQSGAWRELSLYANYLLEQAHLDKTLSVEIEGLHGEMMKVNLGEQEATDWHTDVIYKVKREETTEKEDISQTAPKLPIKWRDGIHPPLDVSKDRRIVILGKTGAGKSSIGNTIFGEKVFATNDSPNSETAICQAEKRFVHGRNITLIDTPGFFDTAVSEEQLKPEITRCIAECAPGPHAILIVLKVEKFTSHENEVFTKICQFFSPEGLRYATVLFTHGNQLSEGVTIQEFVSRNTALKDLVEKCGGRCHVIDNTYWNNNQQYNYRSNKFQVVELLNTIDKMVEENGGGCFTNEMLKDVEAIMQIEEAEIRKESSGKMSKEEIRGKAKKNVYKRLFIRLAGVTTGAVLGAFLGAVSSTSLGVPHVRQVIQTVKELRAAAEGAGCMVAAVGGGALRAAGIAAGGRAGGSTAGRLGTVTLAIAGTGAIAGAVAGGVIGYNAAEGAESLGEAVAMAAHDVQKTSEAAIRNVKGFFKVNQK